MTDDLYPSEKSGLEVIKTIEEIKTEPLVFHTHDGTDGSPKLDDVNVINKNNGGIFDTNVSVASKAVSGVWANLAEFNLSKKVNANKRFLLMLSGSIMHSGIGGSAIDLRFDIDGTDTGTLASFSDTDGDLNGDFLVFSIHYITSELSAATHTFQVEGRSTAGSGQLINVLFSIIEII